MDEADDLFQTPAFGPSEFRFDEKVARVFSDMLRRSIPGYGTLLQLVSIAARRYAVDGTNLYDLGASLGAVTLTMRHAVGTRDVTIVAVDNSPAMVERCRLLTDEDPGLAKVRVELADIANFGLKNASLIVLNFTLQFLPLEERSRVIERCYAGLVPGGVLIVSEKCASEKDHELFLELHDDFREANGYSKLEMARKRAALENVLVTETPDVHEARLEQAGFRVTRWFSALQFASYLAIRPA